MWRRPGPTCIGRQSVCWTDIHNTLFNVVVTEDGHIGSLDTKQLRSRVHEFGGYFQAVLADELRRL